MLPTALPFVLLTVTLPVLAQQAGSDEALRIGIGLQQRGLHEEAARYFEQCLGGDAPAAVRAEASYRLGVARIELGDAAGAAGALRRALEVGGQGFALRAEARYRLATLLAEHDDPRGAAAAFEALLADTPQEHYLRAAASFGLGDAHRALGDDNLASRAYEQAAAAAVDEQAAFCFAARYQQGFAELRLGRDERAASAFGAALGAAPDEAARDECRFLRGDALLRLGRAEEAERDLAPVAAGEGSFADDACYGLGWAALARGDGTTARQCFERLVAQHADSPLAPSARLEAARCRYNGGDPAGARTALGQLLGSPGLEEKIAKEARELRGLAELATGAGAAAVVSLREALASAAPADRARLAFALGEALADQEQWEEAVAVYDAVPDDAAADLVGDARYGACHALHRLGRHRESIGRAEAVLALTPAHRHALLARQAIAENLFALQEPAAALPLYEQLGAGAGGAIAAAARWKVAWCHYLTGAHEAAAGAFATFAESGGVHAEEALMMLALAAFASGDGDAALAAADRYRARHRDGAWLDRTERVAARVLQARGELDASRQRLAAVVEHVRRREGAEAAGVDQLEAAEVAFRAGDFAAAGELFGSLAARRDDVGAKGAAGVAWCRFELGDDDGCRAAIAAAMTHPRADEERPGLCELAVALAHRGERWGDALTSAEQFLALAPAHPRADRMRFALGVAAARSGDHSRARQVLGELLAMDGCPEPDRVRYELAWACRRGGDHAGALQHFAHLAEHGAELELVGEAQLLVGIAALEEEPTDLEQARRWLTAVRSSHRVVARTRLAFALAATAADDAERWREVRALADEALAADDGASDEALRGDALYLAAEASRRSGDAITALERCAQLLRELPQHPHGDDARLCLGECALAAEQPDRAIAPLEEYLRGEARDPATMAAAQTWLGKARLARGEHARAVACFETAAVGGGAIAAEAQFLLGVARREGGDVAGAADAFVKLPILFAEPVWARRGLLEAARCYLRLGQPGKAERLLLELRKDHADSAEAAAAATLLQEQEK